jgi:hypothetical protein
LDGPKQHFILEEVGCFFMNLKNPIVNYVLIGLGVVALAAAVWWTVGPHHHHYREYFLYAGAAVLIAGGLVGMFAFKPKTKTAVVAE